MMMMMMITRMKYCKQIFNMKTVNVTLTYYFPSFSYNIFYHFLKSTKGGIYIL